METELPLLRTLLGDEAGELARGALPMRHLIAHGDPGRFPEALRVGDLGSFEPLLRAYQGPLYMIGGEGDDARMIRVDGTPPPDLLRIGLTVFLFNLLPSIPAAGPVRARLASELGIPLRSVRMAAFVSPAAKGLEPHFDGHEGLIIQLAGEKRYRIGPNDRVKYPVRAWSLRQPFEPVDLMQFDGGVVPDGYPTDLEEVLLEPGSVLFLPRGYWHETRAGTGVSYSISVRVDPPTVAEVVANQLTLAMMRDAAWRVPAYGAWGDTAAPEGMRRYIAARLEALASDVRALSAETALALAGNTAEEQFLHVSAKTEFCRVWTKRIDLVSSDARDEAERASVSIHDTFSGQVDRIELSPPGRRVLAWIARAKGNFRVSTLEGSFPEVDTRHLRNLLQSFVARGLLVIVPGDGAFGRGQ